MKIYIIYLEPAKDAGNISGRKVVQAQTERVVDTHGSATSQEEVSSSSEEVVLYHQYEHESDEPEHG